MSADDEFGEDLESLLSGSTTPPKTTKKTAGRPAPEVPPVIPAAPAFSADDLARLKEELRAEMRAELQGGITVNVAAPDPRRTPALDLSAQVVPKEAEPGTGHQSPRTGAIRIASSALVQSSSQSVEGTSIMRARRPVCGRWRSNTCP